MLSFNHAAYHFNHVRGFRRSLGIADPLPSIEFEAIRKTTSITIIISYCEESIKWIHDYIGWGKYQINEILIYSKCDNDVHGLEDIVELAPTKIIVAENVGRCDHSYVSWIQQHYNEIENKQTDFAPSNMNEDDHIVVFIKDNDYHRDDFYSFEELFTFASTEGFGCAEKPVCDCDIEQCNVKKDIALMYHDPAKLDNFRMNTHFRLERDKKQPFKSNEYKKLKDWREAIGIKMPNAKAVPVCYGGVFAAKRKNILNQSKDVWDRMLESLSRGDNIIEGHFAERLWAVILSNQDEEYTKKVTDNVMPHVKDLFECWNRKGMMMVPRTTGFDKSLFPNLITK